MNIGDLSKPVTTLIEKISDAIGGVFRPYQIRRIAEAQAKAEKIQAISQIEITELQQRAIKRLFIEEANKQNNIETIIRKAIPAVEEDATPENIETDWITNFFDKCRLISDDEMQTLWSKVLAGEANSPRLYSKRTVNALASLDKRDAELFRNLCSFVGVIDREIIPLVYELTNKVYNDADIHFGSIMHLSSIGLVSFESFGFTRTDVPHTMRVYYYDNELVIEFPQVEHNIFQAGCVLLTSTGRELAPICGSDAREGFVEYVIERWRGMGLKVTEQT
jgi:hypothetical protein